MAADPDESTEPSGRRFAVLWFFAAALVAGAAAALVLTDDPRLLRLGLVAGLWAALTGAFAASRQRLRALEARQLLAEQQRKHVAELDREVAERREFELELQAGQQREEAAGTSSQVQMLRAEVHALRQALEQAAEPAFGQSGVRGTSTRLDGGPSVGSGGRGLPAMPEGAAVAQSPQQYPAPQQSPGEPWFSPAPVQRFPGQQGAGQPLTGQPTSGQPISGEEDAGYPVAGQHVPQGVPVQQHAGQAWPPDQPHRVPQQAVPMIGPSSSYGGATHYSGTFSPVGELSEPEPAGPHPGAAAQPAPKPAAPTSAAPKPAGPKPAGPGAEDPPGAHSEGTAVVDLLAAYGSSGAEPGDARNRRRRRS